MSRTEPDNRPTFLVTGGAGFIGSCFVRKCVYGGLARVINLDKLTYAGNLESTPVNDGSRHEFVWGDICNLELVSKLLETYRPGAIVHFAAESHVDRSIDGPDEFVQTNVTGTVQLLKAAQVYWEGLPYAKQKRDFRFLHVSTDEVYGSLSHRGVFTERSPYAPSSPYAASKAAADHFVRAWQRTHGLPTLVTNCSNNYGPHQHPEKLIPKLILNAAAGEPLPLYGNGQNVRDWLFVEDHCEFLLKALQYSAPGQTYNVGGSCERTNLQAAHAVCDAVQSLIPELKHDCRELITFVEDRPGHDFRYALDASMARHLLNWEPKVSFEEGVRRTAQWYLHLRSDKWLAGFDCQRPKN